ncbi:FAD-dependent oxidoreductase [Mycobacterium montefiorense]|uniref:D-amino-acid oxidase n=1 Tax=Mycobacterium montefiorense TaxID=154654 RepID=A0AA37PJG3_9MYCO|nr:FAD-dependent oxidoreductase [Mycobacterium montefiorense]GBG38569.1 D-amino-acid oxidase [Mycobacterium montefiorense]GKU34397.1 D-amino-acid oxidase [Mycobacterium montefiorense]GKU39018.1 D-amino-acid oxidase [Mycobacterium montefiorense]GKU47944.1 D-amino-acid oxidase [Mycobacterium montefiorense]GKU49783.1 D-amino-acid oxidase [Mycobacterium montefiorense]
MDRLGFLTKAAAAAGSTFLSAPAGRQEPDKPHVCLPKVEVTPLRVIHTTAGLRPYRPGGFVVRAESIGAQRLVHNYGHGGSGITLSWGSSKLAVDLGLPGHHGPVAVIGAGVMGLSTARLAQEAGFDVTVYTKALPPDTTSNIAGGKWDPVELVDEKVATAQWRRQFLDAAAYSWRRFQTLVGDDYGIRWLASFGDSSAVSELLPTFPPNSRVLTRDEHPFPIDKVTYFETLYVETDRYLRQLIRDLQTAGGAIQIREFASVGDIAALPEQLVFNCTGFGAAALVGDSELTPMRGQLAILLPQKEIRYSYAFDDIGYMIPRPDGIILGGTYENGVRDATAQPADISRILDSHQNFFKKFRC